MKLNVIKHMYDATITTDVVVDLPAGNIFRPLGWEPEIHSFCFRRVLGHAGRNYDEVGGREIEETGKKG